MERKKGDDKTEIRCKACGSGAVYRYGRIKSGKQRFICLICGRQFVPEPARHDVVDKPLCPSCGKHMNLYKREEGVLRFRCSGYPECRVYEKVILQEEVDEPLHSQCPR